MTDERFVLALAGGVGGGKFARGLAAVLPPEQLAIAVNTADDFVHLGLHISPDVDSVLYALADLNDLERGWGLAGETWNFMAAMERLGEPTWFQLGDRDLATHVLRAQALASGRSLSEVTALLAARLGITHAVVPMTDDAVRSIVETDAGDLDFQDYFVARQCKPRFRGVRFQGVEDANPSAGFRNALARAQAIVIGPSNPFVSIDPILALPGVKDALRPSRRPVVAVSPIVGGKAVKGPLAKMMSELGVEPSALGVAQHYGRLVGGWVIDGVDREFKPAIEALGCRVKVCNTLMRTLDDRRRLAHDAVELAFEMAGEVVG
jgi:LPPG:FO 2-phospho-L-lactate transferase